MLLLFFLNWFKLFGIMPICVVTGACRHGEFRLILEMVLLLHQVQSGGGNYVIDIFWRASYGD